MILSHVSDEADLFVPLNVNTDAQFTTLLDFSYPASAKAAGVDAAIEARYPPVMSANSNYTTERARLKDYIADSGFQCNVRHLTDAYAGRTYNLQYSVFPGLHATDLLPTFYDFNLALPLFGSTVPFPLLPGFGSYAQAYQSYLVSHAQTGDPNTYKKTFNLPPAITWPKPTNDLNADQLADVLDAGNLGFSTIADPETGRARCGFWQDVAAAVTALGGYAPPGSVVKSGLGSVSVGGDPSANY